MNDYFDFLKSIIGVYGYAAIFIVLLLESTAFLGIIVPGVTVLIAAGFISGIGDLSFTYCVIAGILGTFAGDNVSYLIGRYGTEKFGPARRMIDRNRGMQARLRSLNFYMLALFHFPGYLRMVVPILLGAAKYDIGRWLAIDSIGVVLFNVVFVSIGYAIARATGHLGDASSIGNWLQIGFAVFFSIWLAAIFGHYFLFRNGSGQAIRRLRGF